MNRDDKIEMSSAAFEKLAEEAQNANRHYVLQLYVTGMTPRSLAAFASVKAVCEEHLHGHYDLEVIDIYQHPHLAKQGQIIAAPTLVKSLPPPLRRLVGDLSDGDRLRIGLGIQPLDQ